MRKLLLAAPLAAALLLGCEQETPTGPGVAKITETTTSTSTTTTSTSTSTSTSTTTSTIPIPTVAAFRFTPVTPEVLQIVFFTSVSTPGTGRRLIRYDWDFGDGSFKNFETATHDYKISGVYLVTLQVTDDAGTKATTSQPITVRPATPPPPAPTQRRDQADPLQ